MLPLLFSVMLFQPQFHWADQTTTRHGKASLIKTPNGCLVALTSAHFINFCGPPLLSIEWLGQEMTASSTRSWGLPGREGCYAPLDLRCDYLLAVLDQKVSPDIALELDQRELPFLGEKIWFPQINGETIEGSVIEAKYEYIAVQLDQSTDFTARSGTPLVSQTTKRVIGIMTGAEGDQKAFFAPAYSIRNALLEARTFPQLKDVIGDKK